MRVYVIWIEYLTDNTDDMFKIKQVMESEDEASLWCGYYNEDHEGHSAAYYDEFYVMERE